MNRIALCLGLPLLALGLARAGLSMQAQEEHEETELALHMEAIEDALKLVRKNMKDPATVPLALEALVEIERRALECKALRPQVAEPLPEAEASAMAAAYRRTMVDFLIRQLELEAALLDGDAEAAKLAFDRLHDMEDSAHERFAPEED